MEILHTFLMPSAWIALGTLALLEIVLGVDNIIFLSIMSGKLPAHQQPKARTIGLVLAMFARIALLFGISYLMQLTKPLLTFCGDNISIAISGQSIIVMAGGLFLLYKSAAEIYGKMEGEHEVRRSTGGGRFWGTIAQIVLLDIVFSLDSVLTAMGMVSFSEFGYGGALAVMVAAVVAAVLVMLFFAAPVSAFVNRHPSVQMLALSFLLLVGVTLFIEACHAAQLQVFGNRVSEVPKGYIYFAIAFSLLVEVLNLRRSKKRRIDAG